MAGSIPPLPQTSACILHCSDVSGLIEHEYLKSWVLSFRDSTLDCSAVMRVVGFYPTPLFIGPNQLCWVSWFDLLIVAVGDGKAEWCEVGLLGFLPLRAQVAGCRLVDAG